MQCTRCGKECDTSRIYMNLYCVECHKEVLIQELVREARKGDRHSILMPNTIVSWTCHVCESELDLLGEWEFLIGGGFCTRCRRVTCNRHLHSGSNDGKQYSNVCDKCMMGVAQ